MGALSKEDLCQYLCNELVMKREDAKDFLEVFLQEIRCSLEDNEDIKLSNFGNFTLRNKSARPGRNPRTGESAVVVPRRVVTFKPGPKLKESVESYRLWKPLSNRFTYGCYLPLSCFNIRSHRFS